MSSLNHFAVTGVFVPLFQISDIVVGQEPNVSARDVLLKWAKRSTNRYPGVRVSDFTSSWRDGLAFNAIIHRNRPDLVDWRTIRQRHVRERLESAFNVAERVGVTRLLDPEGTLSAMHYQVISAGAESQGCCKTTMRLEISQVSCWIAFFSL